ncbi:hypothetical protein ABZ208_23360, partial [Streptomyces sp. NPDC006208]
MVETGFSSFDTMVDKANRLLKDVEEAFEWPKKPLPYRSWGLSIERESRSGDRGPARHESRA